MQRSKKRIEDDLAVFRQITAKPNNPAQKERATKRVAALEKELSEISE